MKRRHLISTALLALTACNGAGASPATTGTLPPPSSSTVAPASSVTRPPITTTITTTTTITLPPPSTVTPATAPASPGPDDEAAAAVQARLDALWADGDACLAAPADCDVDAFLAEYTTGDTKLDDLYSSTITRLSAASQSVEQFDLVERHTLDIQATASGGYSNQCSADGSVVVRYTNGERVVIKDSIDHLRWEFFWSNVDGQWVIDTANVYNLDISGPEAMARCGY